MVFGTFDLVHKGHLNFFSQAKKLGDKLVVVVARDNSVFEAKSHWPRNNEKTRVKTLRKIGIIDKAILGSKTHDFYRTIRRFKPVVLALGYDQKPSIPALKKDLIRHRIKNVAIMRLRAYEPDIYKSSKLSDR
jgi:FAD synthetase